MSDDLIGRCNSSNFFSRRAALKSAACGFGYLALAGLNASNAHAAVNPLAVRRPLLAPRAKQSLSTFLRKALSLSPAEIGLLQETAHASGQGLSTLTPAELRLGWRGSVSPGGDRHRGRSARPRCSLCRDLRNGRQTHSCRLGRDSRSNPSAERCPAAACRRRDSHRYVRRHE